MSKRVSKAELTRLAALAEIKIMPISEEPIGKPPTWLRTPDGKVFSELDDAVDHMHLLNLASELQEEFGAQRDLGGFPATAVAKWLVSRYQMERK